MTDGRPRPKRLLILGSTGSIGTQTIEVVEHLNALARTDPSVTPIEVVGLAAGRNAELLFEQASALGVRELALAEPNGFDPPKGAQLRTGADSAEALVREVEADLVLAAMVGFKGLPATLAAAELGRDIVLANKETLVAAGQLVTAVCQQSGGALLPVDSEHSGVWQCLAGRADRQGRDALCRPPFECAADVRRITLTASGGAFRDLPTDALANVTPEQAMTHPVWDMGAKVTIDSASLTNKALELIEAHWLFGVGADRLHSIIHPTSTIHALVEFVDASVVAQLGTPDMKTPIQLALTHPGRAHASAEALDLVESGTLEFRAIDPDRYPAIGAAMRVIEEGGTAGAVFNAANEAAVEAFIEHRLSFVDLQRLTVESLDAVGVSAVNALDDVNAADAEARRFVASQLAAATA